MKTTIHIAIETEHADQISADTVRAAVLDALRGYSRYPLAMVSDNEILVVSAIDISPNPEQGPTTQAGIADAMRQSGWRTVCDEPNAPIVLQAEGPDGYDIQASIEHDGLLLLVLFDEGDPCTDPIEPDGIPTPDEAMEMLRQHI